MARRTAGTPEPAADPYGEAGRGLAEGDDHLYVSSAAVEELGGLAPTAQQVEDLRQQLEATSVDVYVAVLPAAAGQVEGAPPQLLYEATGRPGTYLVVTADGRFDAGSTDFAGRRGDALAGEAYAESGGDLGTFIAGFVTRMDDLGGGAEDEEGPGGLPVDARTVGLGAGALTLVLLGSVVVWRRNRRRVERAEVGLVMPVVVADVTAYEEELVRLGGRLATTRDQAAAASLSRADRALDQARSVLDRVERADEIYEVTSALAEGSWYLAVTRARLDGDEQPHRRPPCFFDPRHGPSVTMVAWTPRGDGPRLVPACAEDAALDGDGITPPVREVPLGRGLVRPFHEAGRAYGGWFAGYHGAETPGLLGGTALGAAVGGEHLITEGGFDARGGWAGGRGIEEDRG
jgi:hypothetical protein